MDKVRLGRALGYGARHAAKSVVKAVDAASAPNPSRAAARPAEARPSVAAQVAQARTQVVQTRKHAGRLGRSVWSPLARFSSVLWLQVTGSFFAVIAAFLAQGVWKQRFAARMWGSTEATRFYIVAAVFATFAYLAVSSFVRAWRRERR
jgi:hypothetical protein